MPPPGSDFPLFEQHVVDHTSPPGQSISTLRALLRPVPGRHVNPFAGVSPPDLAFVRGVPSSPDRVVRDGLPLFYLHLAVYPDGALVTLVWRHLVSDAAGVGDLVRAWERELRVASLDTQGADLPTPPPPPPSSAASVLARVAASLTPEERAGNWQRAPSSFPYSIPNLLRMGLRLARDEWSYRPHYAELRVPAAAVEAWVRQAAEWIEEQQHPGEGGGAAAAAQTQQRRPWVSRNDLVVAWLYRTAFSVYAPSDRSNLVRTVSLRGRHPLVPAAGLISNFVSQAVLPSRTTAQLARASLPELALALRGCLDGFVDAARPAGLARHLVGWNNAAARGETWLPWEGPLAARACFVTSWAGMGITAPDFGMGADGERLRTLEGLPLLVGPLILLLIDEVDGGFRVVGRLPKASWDVLGKELQPYPTI